MTDQPDQLERLARENRELRAAMAKLAEAEAAHRRSEQESRAILDNTCSATILTDSTYRILKANPEFAKLVGLEMSDLEQGRFWTEFVADDDVERLKGYARLRRQDPDKAPTRYEFVLRDAHGGPRDIFMNVAVIPGTDLNVASMTDITSLRQAERARMESEISFATAFHHLPHPSVITEVDSGLFIEVNKAFETLTGFGALELSGRTSLEMGLWTDPAERKKVVSMLLDEGRLKGYERDLRTASGRLRHVAMWAVPLVLAGRRRMLSIYVDLTEQRDQQRFQGAVMSTAANLGLGIFIEGEPLTDRASLMFVNPALANLVGEHPQNLVGKKRLWDLVHPISRAEVSGRIGELRAGLQPNGRFDIHLLAPGGGTRLVEVSLSATELEGRSAVVGFCHDVTLARKMEEQVKTNQRMEALGSLAGGIAHDFNNILMAVSGYAEMALATAGDEQKVSESLQQVLKASDRGRELVRQIITFSRGEQIAGRPVSVERLAGETLKLVEASLPPWVKLRSSLQTTNDTVLADPSHINQIVMNLCSNASHALGEDGGEIRVSLDEVEIGEGRLNASAGLEPGSYLELTVADTGAGIAPEVLGKIFDPFFTTKPAGEGTGMGLSVVHGLVQGLGGAISVQSRAGAGSRFRVWLPLCRESAPADLAPSTSPMVGGEKILVVEDEPPLAEVMCAMLQDLGYTVTTAPNGEQGLACFQKNPAAVDLVVTDQSMPQMTGIEMARRIKEQRTGVPVILATGYGGGLREEDLADLGISGVIHKPYRIAELARLIRRALDGRAGDPAPNGPC